MGRLFVCPLVVAFVVVVSAFPQQPVDLLPSWISDGNSENYAIESTTISPGCTASLDVQTHGNPNCPKDQQYFDTDSCQFVCPSTQTPVYPTLTSRKYAV